jgi:hypothetical protein
VTECLCILRSEIPKKPPKKGSASENARNIESLSEKIEKNEIVCSQLTDQDGINLSFDDFFPYFARSLLCGRPQTRSRSAIS